VNLLESGLFTQIDCPACSCPDFKVIQRSAYRDQVSEAQIRELYSAASDHFLRDQLVRCHQCDLVYVNPRIDGRVLIDSYANAADPRFVSQNPERVATFKRVLQGVCRRFQIKPSIDCHILDVGCAAGAFPRAATELGFSVVGVEPSAWLAEYGRREYDVDIRQGVLEPGMFPVAGFEVVSMWDVIEHLPSPHGVLTIIRDLLRDDGLLIVNYPDVGSLASRLLRKRWPFWLSVHLMYYTRRTIALQLQRAGFDVLEMRPHWQTLTLSYALLRASQYLSLFSALRKLADAIGIGNFPIVYNMGQTLVVSRKRR
jgi:2-polyprenyl-3-methyl-5-hydroxy-6-metoxy-1,4-benzoquinol methylase